jgi:MFS family permease
MPWLVYDLTHSVILLGLIGFANQIPVFFLSSFAGVIIDRWNKYHILIITQILAMLQASILAILVLTGQIQIWHIIVLGFFLGLINSFDMPSRQSLMVDMVENKDDLGNAIALNSTMVNGSRILGPTIAGALIAFTGEGICFLINAISFIFVIISILLMKINIVKVEIVKINLLREFKNGLMYTLGFAPIKYILLLLCFVSLMGMSYSVLMPIFARDILHGNSHTFGFLMGASGAGAMIGALYLASKKNIDGLKIVIPASAFVFGLSLLLFSYSRNIYLSMILMVFAGLGMMLQMAASNTVIQTIVDNNMRGRVMGFYTLAFIGASPFGSIIAGSLGNYIGAPATILIGGISCIIGALAFMVKLPTINKII